MLDIYYFPIGAETLRPITSESIEARGALCRISGDDAVSEIKQLLDSAVPAARPEEVFTDKRVRAKIHEATDGGNSLLAIVENDGVVRRKGTDRVLSTTALKQLKTLVEMACRKHGK